MNEFGFRHSFHSFNISFFSPLCSSSSRCCSLSSGLPPLLECHPSTPSCSSVLVWFFAPLYFRDLFFCFFPLISSIRCFLSPPWTRPAIPLPVLISSRSFSSSVLCVRISSDSSSSAKRTSLLCFSFCPLLSLFLVSSSRRSSRLAHQCVRVLIGHSSFAFPSTFLASLCFVLSSNLFVLRTLCFLLFF